MDLLLLCDYLDTLPQPPLWKMAAILLGLPTSIFTQLLIEASEAQLHLLKQEALGHALHHQLTLLLHRIEEESTQLLTSIEQVEFEISRLISGEISLSDIDSFQTRFVQYGKYADSLIACLNKALLLAWNLKDPQLVDPLSTLKESLVKIRALDIGKASSVENSFLGTGLYATLYNYLMNIYDHANSSQEKEKIENTDPAIAGLERLHIWYLQDYFELGLLPHFHSKEEVLFAEQDPLQRKEALQVVIKNLEKVGLSTVENLKTAHIFSRRSLQEFLARASASMRSR
jgi:hypothetical protein